MKRFLSILRQIGPFVVMAIPGVPPALVPVIIEGIGEAEKVFGPGRGAEKLQHVEALAKAAMTGVAMVHDGPVPSPEQAAAAVRDATSAVVQTINVVKSFAPAGMTAPSVP